MLPYAEKLGVSDWRSPFIPNQAMLDDIIEEKSTYLTFPYHNKDNEQNPLVDYNITIDKASITNSSIMHAAEKLSLIATESILLKSGSILVGKEVILKAPVIKIYDKDCSNTRTTIVAWDKLSLEADSLEICGADIFVLKTLQFKLKEISLLNPITKNTLKLYQQVEEKWQKATTR